MVVAGQDLLEYLWLGREEGFTSLEHEVIFRDLCCGCGNCEAVCPEDVIRVDEFPRLVGKCTDCGYCLMECPRSFFNAAEMEEKLFGSVTEDELGYTVKRIGVKTKNEGIAEAAQDGGFVTALLKYALEKGIIDGAIVGGVKEDKLWYPEARLVTSPEELIATAGTRYSNSPNLAALKDVKKAKLEKLAVVGLPCQIEAVRKLQVYPIEDLDLARRIKLTISIFCSSNFLYEIMTELVERDHGVKLEDVVKVDIKGKHFLVFTREKKVEIPLKEAYRYKRDPCKVCTDFTGRLADFAVGSVGSPPGYTSVLARTEEAAKLLDEVIDAGLFETVELKEEKGLAIARKLQQRKEKNAKKEVRRRIRRILPLPYRNMKF
ncbi:Coenzyme F420 hydrogenase/dehydrogenase, beta subunit C-terminal domain [Candidatus Pyrohabitans sp.]